MYPLELDFNRIAALVLIEPCEAFQASKPSQEVFFFKFDVQISALSKFIHDQGHGLINLTFKKKSNLNKLITIILIQTSMQSRTDSHCQLHRNLQSLDLLKLNTFGPQLSFNMLDDCLISSIDVGLELIMDFNHFILIFIQYLL